MASISDTTVSFCGRTFDRSQFITLPMPTFSSNVKEHYMTDGENGNGIRVIEPLGAHISHCDFDFTIGRLSPADVTAFRTAFFNQRTPQTLTITVPSYSSNSYTVIFASGGLSISIDPRAEYYHKGYSAKIKVHIVSGSS